MGHTLEQEHLATLATNLVGDPGTEGSLGTWHGHARAAPTPTLALCMGFISLFFPTLALT